MKQHGGNTWVHSEVGRGTTCKVYLPPTDRAPGASATTAQRAEDPRTEGRVVLLVEGNDPARDVAQLVLEEDGFEVHMATNGEEARACTRDASHELDLLLTDVVVPDMNGRELADPTRELPPGARVRIDIGTGLPLSGPGHGSRDRPGGESIRCAWTEARAVPPNRVDPP